MARLNLRIKLVLGAGLVSVQVFTEKLPGRPFPGYAVLCDIKDDGTIISGSNREIKALRAEIIKQFWAECQERAKL